MILAPVTARLAGLDAKIDDTVALADIASQPVVPPRAVYVIPDDERGVELPLNTAYFEELIDIGFACVAVVGVAAARGLQRDETEALKEAVKGRLIGWKHPESDRPTFYRGAQLLRLDAVAVAMMLRFSVHTRFRAQLT